MPQTPLPVDPRGRIRRYSHLQSHDPQALQDLLDEVVVAHVGFVVDGRSSVIPMGFARDGDDLLLHGSTRGGVLQAGATTAQLTVAVTSLDGFVYASTLYDSTFNFRSAVLQGTAVALEGAAKREALQVLSERIMPGRWTEVPDLTEQQDRATLVLRFGWEVVSLKCRAGQPDGDAPDDIWVGTLPLVTTVGEAEPHPNTKVPVPSSVLRLAEMYRKQAASFL